MGTPATTATTARTPFAPNDLLSSSSHLMQRGRAVLLVVTLVVINLVGWFFLYCLLRLDAARIEYAVTLSAIVTVLVSAPFITFLCLGWYTRYREFENSLKEDALSAYLQRYWSTRLIQALEGAKVIAPRIAGTARPTDGWRQHADTQPDLCDRLFAKIYHEQYGLPVFVPAFVILVAIAYIGAALVGCNYAFDGHWDPTTKTSVYGITQQVLVAGFGGALMFVVSDSVLSIRRKSLNVSDVYWYSLRIVLAVPIALAVGSKDGGDATHAAFVFALGTFPVDALLKIVRRIGFPQVTDFETQQNAPDRLLSLSGVTLPIVAVFEAEGINSIEQLAAADPVILSIRTGFPFRFTLRLCSQAIVRRHLDDDAAKLLPIGLADVVPIYLLVKALDAWSQAQPGTQPPTLPPTQTDAQPQPDFATTTPAPTIERPDLIITNAAARLFADQDQNQREAVIKMKFRQIAAEEFTIMLARITPLDPAL